MQRSTLGLFSLDIRHTTHNIPGKFLQYLSTGLPVFGLSKQSDVVNLIKEKSLGSTYQGNCANEATKIIKKTIQDVESEKIKPVNLINYVKQELSVEIAADKILKSIPKE